MDAAEMNNVLDGWPLRLENLNSRLRAMQDLQEAAAVATTSNSLNMLSDSSPLYSSSELDTEIKWQSSRSFYQDRSITLGSLIGMNIGDGNLFFTNLILPEALENAPMVNFSLESTERHETMISCCICVPLLDNVLAGRPSSRY